LSHALLRATQASHQSGVEFAHPSLREFFLARSCTGEATTLPDFSTLTRPTIELARFLGEFVQAGALDRMRLTKVLENTSRPQVWHVLVALGALESPNLEEASPIERRHVIERAVGLRFDHVEISTWRVERVDLRGASFRGATLRYLQFVDCDLSLCDFAGAHLEEVEFLACSLAGASFDAAVAVSGYVSPSDDRGERLTGRELVEALHEEEERDAWFDATQTEVWHLGLIVRDTLRVFAPIGRPPDRSVLRESVLRNRETRHFVQGGDHPDANEVRRFVEGTPASRPAHSLS
jgi:uncharacterized protein YjbI with pentapeptide repeats